MRIIWNYVWYFFLKSVIDTKIELTGAQKTMNTVKPKKIIHRHIIFKCLKPKKKKKDEVLKTAQIKQNILPIVEG